MIVEHRYTMKTADKTPVYKGIEHENITSNFYGDRYDNH